MPDTAAQADAALQAAQWPQAIDLGLALVAKSPVADNWRRLGRAYVGSGRYAEARQALQKALDADPKLVGAQLYMAVTLGHLGDGDGAFRYLGQAVAQGLSVEALNTLPALSDLRQDKRFVDLLAQADKLEYPCANEPRYRAMDFWIGDWDAHIGSRVAGQELVSLDMGHCIVRARWQVAGRVRGESILYYDPESKHWHLNWVDDSGDVVRYSGDPLPGGGMHMDGVDTTADGGTHLARATWTPTAPGHVHHLIEQSNDGGKTWTPAYDADEVKQ